MRDPAGQLADRLDLLRLAQRILGLHQIGRAFGNTMFERIIEHAQGGQSIVALRFDGAAVFHVDQHTGKARRRPVLVMIDTSVRLDPVEVPIAAANAVLMSVCAASRNRFVDGSHQSCLVIWVNRRDNVVERQALTPKRRIQAEGGCECLVHSELVGLQVPMPCADDRACCQGELDPFHIFASQRFTDP